MIEDAEAIGTVHTASWKTSYAGILPPAFLDQIDLQKRINGAKNRILNAATDTFVLVDETSQKVVGFAELGPCREKNVDADGELYAIYLFRESQGKGGGRVLVEAIIRAAQEKGFSKVMVSTFDKNNQSRKFYEKMGAQYIGADHVDVEGVRYPTSTYLWNLK